MEDITRIIKLKHMKIIKLKYIRNKLSLSLVYDISLLLITIIFHY